MIAGGLTPMKALSAATRMRGRSHRRVPTASAPSSPGAMPDLVATAGDPIADPAQFAHVDFRDEGRSRVYRQGGHPTVAGGQ